jgi:hypothetical protein
MTIQPAEPGWPRFAGGDSVGTCRLGLLGSTAGIGVSHRRVLLVERALAFVVAEMARGHGTAVEHGEELAPVFVPATAPSHGHCWPQEGSAPITTQASNREEAGRRR